MEFRDTDAAIYGKRFGVEEMGGRIELWRVLCRYWFSKYIAADSCTLDLGAGFCEFINNIECRRKIAVEHNGSFLEFADPNVECIVADLEEGLAQVQQGSVDNVVASNVFEHLQNREQLFQCLRAAWRVLRTGGRIIIMQPNYAAVRERFYDFSDHSLPLTEKGMAEAVAATGFAIERVIARFLPYTTKRRYPRWPFLVRLYLLCPPAHWLLGGQMFIVGRKTNV
jgi:SAM-dependent methyltransferase